MIDSVDDLSSVTWRKWCGVVLTLWMTTGCRVSGNAPGDTTVARNNHIPECAPVTPLHHDGYDLSSFVCWRSGMELADNCSSAAERTISCRSDGQIICRAEVPDSPASSSLGSPSGALERVAPATFPSPWMRHIEPGCEDAISRV